MLYYTQLIYIKEERAEVFHEFENHVLPLLADHQGVLMLRLRPGPENMIAGNIGLPYEIHLVSFPSRQNFLAYAADDRRQKFLHLKDESVLRVILIEGAII